MHLIKKVALLCAQLFTHIHLINFHLFHLLYPV